MSLHSIEQLSRSPFGNAARPAEERDRDSGFSDLLRRSVDRMRELHAVERRHAPRTRPEAASASEEPASSPPTTARPGRRANDSRANDGAEQTDSQPARSERFNASKTQAKGERSKNRGGDSGAEDSATVSEPAKTETPKTETKDGITVVAEIEDSVEIIAKDPNASEKGSSDAVVAFVATTVTVAPIATPVAAGSSVVPTVETGSESADEAPASAALASVTPLQLPLAQSQDQANAAPAAPAPVAFAPVLSALVESQAEPLVTPTLLQGGAPAQPLPAADPDPTGKVDLVEAKLQIVAPQIMLQSAAPNIGAPEPTQAPQAAPTPAPQVTTVVIAPGMPAGQNTADQKAEVDASAGLPVAATVVVVDQAKQLVSKPNAAPAMPTEERSEDVDAMASPGSTASNAPAVEPEAAPLPLQSGNAANGNAGAGVFAAATSNSGPALVSPGAASGVTTGANQPDMNVAPTAAISAAVEATVSAGVAEQAELAAPVDAEVEAPNAHQNFVSHLQQADQSQSSSRSAAAQQPQAQTPQHVADQVAVHISKAIKGGEDRIKIELKPANLGTIEVQLKLAADGHVQAVIAADRPETLELMQRDARGLEKALNEAGLKTDPGSLSFNLRGQDSQRDSAFARNEFSGRGGRGGVDVARPEDDISSVEAMVALSRTNGGIDLRV